MTCKECIHKSVCYRASSVQSDYAQKCGDFVLERNNNLCDSCTNTMCAFQSGIVRKKCDFYIPPKVELIPYLIYKETGAPLIKCQKAYELAIEYLRRKPYHYSSEIEIVIKIPAEIYEASQILHVKYEDTVQIPLEVIANGVPLPKEHGKLIILSEDAVKREQTLLSFSNQKWINEVGLSNATVAIIEANKTESDE